MALGKYVRISRQRRSSTHICLHEHDQYDNKILIEYYEMESNHT